MKKIGIMLLLVISLTALTSCEMGQVADGGLQLSLEEKEQSEDVKGMVDEQMEKSDVQADEVGDEFLTAKEQEYNEILDEALREEEAPTISLAKRLLLWFYDYYTTIRLWGTPVCICSVVVGFVLFLVARGNKGARKFALFGLILGVPLLYVFMVFGVGALNDIFLY